VNDNDLNKYSLAFVNVNRLPLPARAEHNIAPDNMRAISIPVYTVLLLECNEKGNNMKITS